MLDLVGNTNCWFCHSKDHYYLSLDISKHSHQGKCMESRFDNALSANLLRPAFLNFFVVLECLNTSNQ